MDHPKPHDPRHEKLKTIAAVFGSDIAARLDASQGDASGDVPAMDDLDPERLAWQQNRLIQHVRKQGQTSASTAATSTAKRPTAHPDPIRVDAAPKGAAILTRLQSAAHDNDLSGEHPAVITHLLRAEPQTVRVAVLRRLPGQTARAVMQRLRST